MSSEREALVRVKVIEDASAGKVTQAMLNEVDAATKKLAASQPAAAAAVKQLRDAVVAAAEAQKQGADTTGYYLDKLGRVHDASGKFVSAKTAEGKAIRDTLKEQIESGKATAGAAKATDYLTESITKSTAAKKNNGMAALQMGRAIQDLQFGILGVLNNIEGLVMALGGTAGLAGVLTLVGVALSMLLPHIGKLGDDSAKTAAEAAKLAAELDATADASEAAAESALTAATAEEERAAAVEATRAKYAELRDAIEGAIKAREAEQRAAAELDDAQGQLEIARINDKESRGIIPPAQAEEQRRTAQRAAEKRKFDRDQQAAAEKEAALQADAAMKRGEAAFDDQTAAEAESAARGLLTPDQRKAAEDRLAAEKARRLGKDGKGGLADQRSAAQEEAQRFAKRLADAKAYGSTPPEKLAGYESAAQMAADRAAQLDAEYQASLDATGAATNALLLDERIREDTGFTNRGDASKAARDARAAAAAKRAEAARMDRDARNSAAARRLAPEAFDARTQAADITSRSRIAKYNADEFQRRTKEEKKREGSGGSGAAGELRQALQEAVGGGADLKELLALLKQMAAQKKARDAQTAAELEETKAALRDSLSGN